MEKNITTITSDYSNVIIQYNITYFVGFTTYKFKKIFRNERIKELVKIELEKICKSFVAKSKRKIEIEITDINISNNDINFKISIPPVININNLIVDAKRLIANMIKKEVYNKNNDYTGGIGVFNRNYFIVALQTDFKDGFKIFNEYNKFKDFTKLITPRPRV